jgi:hypothetical protein
MQELKHSRREGGVYVRGDMAWVVVLSFISKSIILDVDCSDTL